MSFIHLPDPDPGRCKNHRPSKTWNDYGAIQLRCLDYEGHDSKCTFPEDPKPVPRYDVAHSIYTNPEKPKPWVSPLHAEIGYTAPQNT